MGKLKNYRIYLQNSYSYVLKYLQENGKVSAKTESGKSFEAEALVAEKSKLHPNEQYIGFFQFSTKTKKRTQYGRCFEIDWGNYLNESGTIIGTYCQALDAKIS